MGLIIRGNDIEAFRFSGNPISGDPPPTVQAFVIQNFLDEPKFKLKPTDGKPRPNTWVRGIVLHTTRGIPGGKDRRPQVIKPGLGPNHKRDEKVALMWSLDKRKAGAHLITDSDASWVQTADLQDFAAYHAGNVNTVTIGIEIYQQGDAVLYEGQLENVVQMVDLLTRIFSIQRQLHWPYKGHAIKRGLNRGLDMVGTYGHRDVSNNRGPGDPGDAIMEMLIDAGYESFDFEENEDKEVWMQRQEQLGLLADGVPGPATVAALLKEGYNHGLWVSRPGD
jgi:hypothetical protein